MLPVTSQLTCRFTPYFTLCRPGLTQGLLRILARSSEPCLKPCQALGTEMAPCRWWLAGYCPGTLCCLYFVLSFLGLLGTLFLGLGCAPAFPPLPHFSAQVRWLWVSRVGSLGLAFCLCEMGMAEFCLEEFSVTANTVVLPGHSLHVSMDTSIHPYLGLPPPVSPAHLLLLMESFPCLDPSTAGISGTDSKLPSLPSAKQPWE